MSFHLKPVVQQITGRHAIEAVVWNGSTENLTTQPIDPNVFRDRAIVASRPQWLPQPSRVLDWDQQIEAATVPRGDVWCCGNSLWIGTPEGPMQAEGGDFIVRGSDGQPYPVKAEVFAHLFDPA